MCRQRRPVIWGHIPPHKKQYQRETEDLQNTSKTLREAIPGDNEEKNQQANEAANAVSEQAIDEVTAEEINTLNHYPPNKPYYPPGSPSNPHHPPGWPDMPDCANLPLAQAYIPVQPCNSPMYSPREALEKGTLFPALYRPYPH